VRVAFHSPTAVREVRLDAGASWLDLALTTGAAMSTLRTTSFTFAGAAGATLRTSQPGGFVERQPTGLYSTTFWPAVQWASVGGTALLLRQSTGVHFGAAGEVELMAVRDARLEGCDIEGGTGSDTAEHTIEWRIQPAKTPVDAERAALAFNRPVQWVAAPQAGGSGELPVERSLISIDGDGVVSALKPATRGAGTIVRVLLMPGPATLHLPPGLASKHLVRVDAAERDLEDLGTAPSDLALDPMRFGSIASLRFE
jgi:hypothetical protein